MGKEEEARDWSGSCWIRVPPGPMRQGLNSNGRAKSDHSDKHS